MILPDEASFERTKKSIDDELKTLSLEEQVEYLALLNKYAFNLWLSAYVDLYRVSGVEDVRIE